VDKPTLTARTLKLAEQRGVLRARDLRDQAIPAVILSRLVDSGQLTRISRGLYTLPTRTPSEQHQLAEVAARSPTAVYCLLTALRFHGITTQNPHELWIALPNKSRSPRIEYPPLRTVRYSGDALTQGIEVHTVDCVTVKVYSIAKTIADCFKFRNKIGLDVALEALREARQGKRATSEDLWRFAKICRVANVMRPYLESLT
jgi:predicted transcriptional regulator of viral defense system